MVDTVIFPVELGGDGQKVTNDNDSVTGMGKGGHRKNFVRACNNVVAIAGLVVNATTNLASKASQVALDATNAALASLTTLVGTKADASSVSGSISTINSSLALKAPINNAAFTGTPTAPTPAADDSSTKIATTAFVDANGVKVGSIILLGGDDVPTGYLAIPTAATEISRTTYARLFAKLGTKWGTGNGTTTFNMPFIPPDYTVLQAAALLNVATQTVGEVIAHDHTLGLQTGAPNGQAASSSPNFVRNQNTGVTGGPANKAAGMRFQFAIKY
jgi:hypothetical protein